ncbi:MAG: hypothetical protein V7750_07570 [Sneathiella sp.]
MLKWQVSETYPPGEEPNAEFWWSHDPNAYECAKDGMSEFGDFMAAQRFKIYEAGYIQSDERAAFFAILSLIPHLGGSISRDYKQSLKHVFENAKLYALLTGDLLYPVPNLAIAPEFLMTSMLYRVLLDDALDEALSVDEWTAKAEFFLGYCPKSERKNNMVWSNQIYPNIGWPQLITGDLYRLAVSKECKPDLLSLLCLYEKHDYAETLIDLGYDLKDFILYAFQKNFWVLGDPTCPVVRDVKRYCDRAAVNWIEITENAASGGDVLLTGLKAPTENPNLATQLSDSDKISLNWMISLVVEGSDDSDMCLQAEAAMDYLITFKTGLDVQDYMDLDPSEEGDA